MNRQIIALILAVTLPSAGFLQGCGKNGVSPTPIPDKSDPSNIGKQIVQNACAANDDVDSDGDGICDKDEEADPTLGPKCVHNPDCDGNGTSDGDDPSWWVKNRWTVIKVALAGLATWYLLDKCVFDGEHKGCDFVKNDGIGVGDGHNDDLGATTPIIGAATTDNVDFGSGRASIENLKGGNLFSLIATAKTKRSISFTGGVDLGTSFGIFIAAPIIITSAFRDDSGRKAIDIALPGDYAANVYDKSTFKKIDAVACGDDMEGFYTHMYRLLRSAQATPSLFMGVRRDEAKGTCIGESLPAEAFNPNLVLLFPASGLANDVATFQIRFVSSRQKTTFFETGTFQNAYAGKVFAGVENKVENAELPRNPITSDLTISYWSLFAVKTLNLGSEQPLALSPASPTTTMRVVDLFHPAESLRAAIPTSTPVPDSFVSFTHVKK